MLAGHYYAGMFTKKKKKNVTFCLQVVVVIARATSLLYIVVTATMVSVVLNENCISDRIVTSVVLCKNCISDRFKRARANLIVRQVHVLHGQHGEFVSAVRVSPVFHVSGDGEQLRRSHDV